MKQKQFHAASSVAALGFLLQCAPAWAVESDPPESAGLEQKSSTPGSERIDTGQIADIVVTAQRRSESLQKVPISVAAVTEELMQSAGVVGTADIAKLVPGIVINNNIGSGVVYIRGVGQGTAVPGAESPVGVYIDGVYLVAPGSGLFDFNSVERVEVLRGPQGTLFGRNTTGGLINIITRNPSETFKLDANVGYGNYDTYNGQLYLSGPLGGGLSASVAAFGTRRADGIGRNVTLGIDVLKQTSYGVQGKLRWEAPDGLTDITLSGLYSYSKGDLGATFGVPAGSIGGDGSLYLGRYVFASSVNEPPIVKHGLISGRLTHDFGPFQIMNLAAYHTLQQSFRFAQLGYDNNTRGPLDPFAAQYPNLIAKDNTFSNEFQIQAPDGSRLQWIVGAYYMYDYIPVFHTEAKPNNVLRLNVDSTQKMESYAGYAQATYPLVENTRLTGGVRWTKEIKRITGAVSLANGVVISTPANPGQGATPLPPASSWSKATVRAALDHDLSDNVLVYASFNTGFKGGVYNLASYTNKPANPENVTAYEIGFKSFLFDRHLRLNIAAFLMNYSDVQLRTVVDGFFQINNAAKARMKGVTVDFEGAVTDSFTVRGGAEVLDAKYTSFPRGLLTFPNPISPANLPANCRAPAAFNPLPGGNTQLVCDLGGYRMVRAPKFTFNLGAEYRVDLSNGAKLKFNVNDAYNSGFFFDPDNRLKQESYHDLGGSITWISANERFDVSGWIKNAADENILATATGGASDTYAPGLPRTYGIRVGLHF